MYLFAWNPNKWPWESLEKDIQELHNTGKVAMKWSCASHRRIKLNDRVFMVRLGSTPRGIMASGRVISEPFTDPHWNGEDREIWKVIIEFDALLNPSIDPLLPLDALDTGNLAKQRWTPMASGVAIVPEAAKELEEEWFHFLTTQQLRFPVFTPASILHPSLLEGAAIQAMHTRYERNAYARRQCLAHHGYVCAACRFDFEKTYGSLGQKFIHVHHRTMISTVGKVYAVDPLQDLVPVCPNCHAMLHHRNPPLTIDELKQMMQDA